MDFKNILFLFRRRWRIASISSCLFFLCAAAATSLTTVEYRSTCKVLCSKPLDLGFENLIRLGFLEGIASQDLTHLLKSQELVARLHRRLLEEGNPDPPSVDSIASNLWVKDVEGTRWVEIALKGPDHEWPRSTLNLLLEEAADLWQEQFQNEVSSTRETIVSWSKRLDLEAVKLEENLESIRQAAGLTGPDRGFEREVRDLRHTVQKQRTRIEELRKTSRKVQEELMVLEGSAPGAAILEGIDRFFEDLPELKTLRDLNEELVQREIKLLSTLLDNPAQHPAVKNLREEIENLKGSIDSVFQEGRILNQYLELAKRPVPGGLELKILEKKIQLKSIEYLIKITRESLTADTERLYLLLENQERYVNQSPELKLNKKTRSRLENARLELKLLESPGIRSFKIAEHPSPAEFQGKTPGYYLPIAFGLAVLAGLAVAWLRELLDDKIYTARDLKRHLEVSPLAAIPLIPDDLDRRSESGIATRASRSPGIREDQGSSPEECFELAVRRLFSQGEHLRTVLIAGAERSAGKSFLTVELARAAARLGRRVAVVDACGCHPEHHQVFRKGNHRGLSDLLSGDLKPRLRIQKLAKGREEIGNALGGPPDFTDLVEEAEGKNEILFIPIGPPRPDFARLLESRTLSSLLEKLSSLRDVVFIDSKALSLSGEALSLAPHVDGVLLTARAGMTRANSLSWARSVLLDVGANILGVILNGARPDQFATGGGSKKGDRQLAARDERSDESPCGQDQETLCPLCLSGIVAPRPAEGERIRCGVCQSWTFSGISCDREFLRDIRGGFLARLLGLLPFGRRSRSRFAGMGKGRGVLALPLDCILAGEIVPRRSIDLNRQKILERSIALFGILVPLVVRPVRDGYQLVTGHRRLLAAKRTGLRNAPVVIWKCSRKEATIYRYLENSAEDPPGPLEEAEGFEKIFLAEPRLKQAELCRRLGLDPSWLSGRLEVLSMPQVIRDALLHRVIDLHQAQVLNRLGNIEDVFYWIERFSRGEATVSNLLAELSGEGGVEEEHPPEADGESTDFLEEETEFSNEYQV